MFSFVFSYRIMLWVIFGISMLNLAMHLCNAIVRMPVIIRDLQTYHHQRLLVNQEQKRIREEKKKKEAERKRILKEQQEQEQALERELEREMADRKKQFERELKERLETLRKQKRETVPAVAGAASIAVVEDQVETGTRPRTVAAAVAPLAVAEQPLEMGHSQARIRPRLVVGDEIYPSANIIPNPHFKLEISSALAKRRQEKSMVMLNKEQ